jgi:uncharacterized protein YjdB
MHQRLAGLLVVAVAAGCAADQAARVSSIDIQASGGGPLLITAIGGTLQLAASPRDAAGHPVAGAALAWTSGNPTVATVDAKGLVTALANGTVDITASAGAARARTTVTVAQASDSVAIVPPSASIERGATASFTAAVVDSRGNAVPGAAVEWSTRDPSIAAISAAGVATGLAVGTTAITATSGGKSSNASLAVTVPVASSVAVGSAQAGALTSIGDTRQLTATATDARGAAIPEAAFHWSSSDSEVASTDAAGLVTAHRNGTTTITASSGTAEGSLAVPVAQAVHSLVVSPASQSIAPDALFTFTAQPLDANSHPVATPNAASWNVDDSGVATIDASTGQVHGNANATALATTHVHAAIGSITGSARLTIDPAMAPVVSISLPQPSGSLASIGDTLQLEATALNQAGNAIPGVAFSWSSNHPAIATVAPSSGLVTAKGNGSATITVSGGGKSATASVTVQQVIVEVVLSPPAITTLTSIDDTLQLTAVANDARGHAVAGALLIWTSSDPSIAAVSNTGLVTAKGNAASVTITVSSSAFHDQAVLAVAQAVHAVNLTPSSDSVAPNTALDFTAAGVDGRGHLVAGAPPATWRSSNPLVTVSSTGHAIAGSLTAEDPPVTITITATIAGVDGTAALTVDPKLTPVDQVVVAGGGVSLASIGDTVQLSAQALDAIGTPLARTISWAVQDGSADVVTVGPTGLVTAMGNGQKTIVASTGGVSGTATVTVSQVLASARVSTAAAGASTTLTSLGDTLALQAAGFDARNHVLPGGTFTWRSDSANARVSPNGLVTAVANGAANIFARSGDVESAPGFAVTVAQAVDHIGVSAGGSSTTLTSIGDTLQLAATAFDTRDNPMAATFTWSPTSGAAANVGASSGLVTAAANGTTSVQAAAGGKTGSISITVAQAVASVSVSGPASLTSLGETAQLTATASDARGHAVSGASFSWRSDGANVTVGAATGVVTAAANGSANIFARSGAVESPAHAVTVAQAVASISVSGNSTLGSIGDTTQLSAAAFDANANAVAGITFAWSVQDGSTSVVTVDASTGVVTAVGNGTKNVVASARGKSGSLAVTVSQVPASVTVATAGGAAMTLTSIGDTVQLTASAADARGHAISGGTFTWRSDSTAVATVSASGLVSAAGNGTANIFAKAGAAESSGFAVTVAQVVASVEVTPPSGFIVLFFGTTTLTFSDDPKDARGNSVAGAPAASWGSSDTAIATIDSTGTAHAVNASLTPVTITATIATVSGTAQLTVTTY